MINAPKSRFRFLSDTEGVNLTSKNRKFNIGSVLYF